MANDFIFLCPFCGQKLECDESLENQVVPCPSCGKEIAPTRPISDAPAPQKTECHQVDRKFGRLNWAIPIVTVIVFVLGAATGFAICYFAFPRELAETMQAHPESVAEPQIANQKAIGNVAAPSSAVRTVPAQKMIQIEVKSQNWSNPTPAMLKGMSENDIMRRSISPIIAAMERIYPKKWDMARLNRAARCTIKGDPAQIYITGRINNNDAALSMTVQKDDSDDKYDFPLYVTVSGKVFTEYAFESAMGLIKLHELEQRVVSRSNKKKTEIIEISSKTILGRSYYGSVEFSYNPEDASQPISTKIYETKNGWLDDIQMSGDEFCRLSYALDYGFKLLSDHHLKRFYWYRK